MMAPSSWRLLRTVAFALSRRASFASRPKASIPYRGARVMGAIRDFKTGEELDPFDAAYRRVRAQYEAARLQADRFGGPCEKCRHFRSEGGTLSEDFCMNPLVVSFAFDRDQGEVVTRGHMIKTWMSSRKAPGIPDLCGDDRRLWEARTALAQFNADWWGLYVALIPIAFFAIIAWAVSA